MERLLLTIILVDSSTAFACNTMVDVKYKGLACLDGFE